MSLPGPKFTYEDYRLLPEDKRYELMEGELLVTPAPTTRHQKILVRLVARLETFVDTADLGEVLCAPTDVILSDETVVQPDILFVARDRRAIVNPNGAVTAAPDLVVEILSPSTSSRDRVLKRKLYAKFGVREYWIVDPANHTVEVLVGASDGMNTWKVFPATSALTSPLLSDLVIALDKVFAE